jgi:phosphatidylserine/phosphatidylglycerophosphate/cardiolipin synthase-like enzyme
MFKRLSPDPRLYDEKTFYSAFIRDILKARTCVVIESPFITKRRFYELLPALQDCLNRGVRIVINTRNPDEHDPIMLEQSLKCIELLQELGVEVLYTFRLHRKIAIIDGIIYEGSLNILSQNDSCEIMRRTADAKYAQALIDFTKMARWYN